MRREYGALDGETDPPGPSSSSGGGGWPSWWRLRRQRGGALGGCASFFGGTRESVSVANCLMEMQAAVVVSACVATLSAGLFHRDPATRVDPSLPWSAQGSELAGANSPTFVSLVHVTAHGGYVLAAPIVGVGVELLGFPVVTALAAALCPLVASGYAALDFTRVSRGLVRARLVAGAWKATHELSTASGNAVAFTPAASAQAFGWQSAVWSVVSVAAPFAIALLVAPLGVPGVFIALSATGFAVFCAATVLVLTPWMAAGGDLPPRAPCAPFLSEEEDGDDDDGDGGEGGGDGGDGGDGGEGGVVLTNDAKKAAKKGLVAAASSPLSPRSTPTPSSWASTCVSMLRDPETRCVIAVSAAMGAAEYSVAGAVMMLLSGVMSFDASKCAMFLAVRELPDVAVQLSAAAYLRVVSVPGTFTAGLALAAGATAALAALGAAAGDDPDTSGDGLLGGGIDRRLVFAAGCAHGLGVGAVKVATLPAMSQLVEDRHGGMFGVGLGAQGFAQKLAGGAVGMVGLAVLIEVVGFTRALGTFASALAACAVYAWRFARDIRLRFESSG